MRRLCLVIGVLLAGLMFGRGLMSLAHAADYPTYTDCPEDVGIFDAATHTCTLTGDVYGAIEIKSDDVTLDGNGHAIIGPGINGVPLYGVYVYQRMGATIKNLTFSNWNTAIWMYRGYMSTLANLTFRGNAVGAEINDSVITLRDNRFEKNMAGLRFINFSSVTMRNNALTDNQRNFNAEHLAIFNGEQDIDTSNTLNGKPLWYVRSVTDTRFENLGEIGAFYCVECMDVMIDGFSIDGGDGPGGVGVVLANSHHTTVQNGTIANVQAGILLYGSPDNEVYFNTFHIANHLTPEDKAVGISLSTSNNNRVLDNNFIEPDDISNTQPVSMGHNNFTNTSALYDLAERRGNYWSRFDTPEEGCVDADGDRRCDGYFNLDVGQYYPVSIEYAWTMQNGWSDSPSIPTIISISPNSGPVGTLVTITGNNFGDNQGDGTLTFSSTEAVVLSWSDTKIDVTVPQLPVGSYDVSVTTNIVESNSMIFDVVDIDGNDQLHIGINISSDQVWANGHEESGVTVIVTDANGQGMPDRSINLTANPPDGLIITPKKQPVITNASGEASFVVTSNQTGVVVLTATDADESTLTTSAEMEFIQRRVVVFVQGIQTELNRNIEHTIFHNIRQLLISRNLTRPTRGKPEMNEECANIQDDDKDSIPNDGCPLVLNYSYTGGSVDGTTGIWRPQSYVCQDTAQNLNASALKLRQLIQDFSRENANTRFIVIGHSQGGLIAIPTLSLAQRSNIIIDTFISLDGALGGVPSSESRLANLLPCWGKPASKDMSKLWESADDHDRQGSTASFLGGQTNNDLVNKAQSSRTKVITVGNRDDCVFNPSKCSVPFPSPDNTSTQIIENDDDMGKNLLNLGGNCPILSGDEQCITRSHSVVLNSTEVIFGIIDQAIGSATTP